LDESFLQLREELLGGTPMQIAEAMERSDLKRGKKFVRREWSCKPNFSPPHRGDTVTAPLPSGEPKWRGNFPEQSDHLLTPNHLEFM